MKFRIFSICLLVAVTSVGCSDTSTEAGSEALGDVITKVQDEPRGAVEYANLFDPKAFEQRNVRFLDARGDRYVDSDLTNYVYLNAGVYTSESQAALRFCADLNANGANPAISIRGASRSENLTAMLTENNTKISIRKAGDEGSYELSNGRLCITSATLPAGSKLTVLVFPAISNDRAKHEKSAVGDLEIQNITVSWVPA